MPTVEAPRFYRGYRAGLAASLAMTAWTPVVWFFMRKQQHEQVMLVGSDGTSNGSDAGVDTESAVVGKGKEVDIHTKNL